MNRIFRTDEELYQEVALLNNAAAYGELYDRYKRALIVYALRKVSKEEAEDLVHDLFTKFWVNRYIIVVEGKFSAYIFRALRNHIIDFIAHKDRVGLYLNSLEDFKLTHFSNLADYKLREEMFLKNIESLLSRFAPNSRQIVRLRMQGYSNTEIALSLGLSEKTIRNQYAIMIKHLRSKLPFLLFIYFT